MRSNSSTGIISAMLVFLFALISSQGCKEKTPTGVFDELTDSTTVGQKKFVTIPQPVFSNTGAVRANMGKSPFLYLGRFDGRTAAFLMKFENLPDSLNLVNAQIILGSSAAAGAGDANFNASVHRVVDFWTEDSVNFETFANGYDLAVIGSGMITPADSDTVALSLDPGLVRGWLDSTIINHGVFVEAEGAAFFKQLNAREALSSQPVLRLVDSTAAGLDTLDVLATADAFIFEVLTPPADGPLYIGDGQAFRTILRFDLSGIPESATVNRAVLTMQVDSSHSFLSRNDGFVFQLFSLVEEVTDPVDSLDNKIVPLSTTLGVVDTSSALIVTMSNQVQNWTRGTDENFGFILLPTRSNRDLFRTAIYSRQTDATRAPRLEVYYTIPPVSR